LSKTIDVRVEPRRPPGASAVRIGFVVGVGLETLEQRVVGAVFADGDGSDAGGHVGEVVVTAGRMVDAVAAAARGAAFEGNELID
jgi:hypothetical protein